MERFAMTVRKLISTLSHRLAALPALLLFAAALGLSAPVSADEVEGPGYREVDTDVTSPEGEILVQEFFWYACPHCYHLEAELEPWAEELPGDVVLERRALALGQHWMPLTQAFWAAEEIGVVDATHTAVFDAIHRDGRRLMDRDSIADFYADQGVDRDAFLEAYRGFAVRNEVRRTADIARAAGVRGVPALLVDGRFLITGRLAGSHERMLEVADELIARIRDERG